MNIEYNSTLILSLFFISFFTLILNYITKGRSNVLFFSSYRNSLLNPLTYVRLVTHTLGHGNWTHFMSNYIYILLVGPMIEQKYGTISLLKMMIITSVIIALFNFIFSKKAILGSSGLVYMLIPLTSNINENKTIPLTLILVCLFFVANEIIQLITKSDNTSHVSHFIGLLCGVVFLFYPI